MLSQNNQKGKMLTIGDNTACLRSSSKYVGEMNRKDNVLNYVTHLPF